MKTKNMHVETLITSLLNEFPNAKFRSVYVQTADRKMYIKT